MDETGTAARAAPDRPRHDEAADQRHWWAGHESGVPDGLVWLSTAEQARLGTLRFTKRRNEYLLRRWVGKRAVAARVGLDTDPTALARIEVLNAVTGAPYVVIDGSVAAWEVTLSDRAGCAVAVVGAAGPTPGGPTTNGTIGVDLEVVEPRTEGFVTDFLTPAEQAWVRGPAVSDPRLGRDAAANLVWSAKEAVLKVMHLGLRADTRWVEVTVEAAPEGELLVTAGAEQWGRFVAAWRGGEVLPGWWRREGDYLLTVAERANLETPTRLPGSVELASPRPVHSWVEAPLVSPAE